MKNINNKIKKPFLTIGFDKTGKVVSNIDFIKISKFNKKNLFDTIGNVNNIINDLNLMIIDPDIKNELKEKPSSLNYHRNQTLIDVREFCDKNKIIIPNRIKIDHLVEVDSYIKNNMKLGAVKAFKNHSGCGLKDSNDFIKWYADKHNFKFSRETNHKFNYNIL